MRQAALTVVDLDENKAVLLSSVQCINLTRKRITEGVVSYVVPCNT